MMNAAMVLGIAYTYFNNLCAFCWFKCFHSHSNIQKLHGTGQWSISSTERYEQFALRPAKLKSLQYHDCKYV